MAENALKKRRSKFNGKAHGKKVYAKRYFFLLHSSQPTFTCYPRLRDFIPLIIHLIILPIIIPLLIKKQPILNLYLLVSPFLVAPNQILQDGNAS